MKTFNKLAFLNEAISTDKFRHDVDEAFWDAPNKRLAATDGRRLHIWNLSDGYEKAYKLPEKPCYVKLMVKDNLIVPLEKDERFPSIDRVIPKRNETLTAHFDRNDKDHHGRFLVSLFTATQNLVNLEYLKPLFGQEWKITTQGIDKAMRFDGADDLTKDLIAVIMPVDPKEASAYVTLINKENEE